MTATQLGLLTIGQDAGGNPFGLPPELVTRTQAIIGIRGSGKTTAATVMAEEFCKAGLPFVALDPTGVWWGLRANPDGTPGGFPVLVVGGAKGDLPLDKDQGARLADAFVAENVAMVVDLKRESKTAARKFVGGFCDRLLEREPQTPRGIILEEGPEFVPQRAVGIEQTIAKAAVDRVVRLGRNSGYGCTILSQRFATIDKDVLTQCENLLAMRSIGKPDRTAVRDWIAECVQPEPDEPTVVEFLNSLATLKDGEGWYWSPQWLGTFDRIRIRQRETLHPGATRIIGQRAQAVELSDVSAVAARLRRILVAVAEPAPGSDQAERGVRSARATTKQRREEGRAAEALVAPDLARELKAHERETNRLREALAAAEHGQAEALHRAAGEEARARELSAALATCQRAFGPLYEALRAVFGDGGPLTPEATATTGGNMPPQVRERALYEAWMPKFTRSSSRKMLTALLDAGGELSMNRLSLITRLKKGTGSWANGLAELRKAHLIGQGDPVRLLAP